MNKVKLNVQKLYNENVAWDMDPQHELWSGVRSVRWKFYERKVFRWRPNPSEPFNLMDVCIAGKWHTFHKKFLSFVDGKVK